MTTLTVFLPDPTATDRLGEALATLLEPGDAVLLRGDLGMGKSHLARRVIQTRQAATGPVEDVPSPTYTLVQTYRAGEIEMIHADLYRLGDPSELLELGLEDGMAHAISLIEWPDRLETPPDGALHVELTAEGAGRNVTLEGDDASWETRLGALREALHG